jgi:hypothetical protein
VMGFRRAIHPEVGSWHTDNFQRRANHRTARTLFNEPW